MKYVFSNGLKLEVREIGEVIYQLDLKNKRIPLPIITKEIMTDDEARKVAENIKNTRNYKRVK